MDLALVDHDAAQAELADGRITMSADAFARATNWTLKPEGLCRGPVCVPVSGTDLVTDGRIDVTAFADRMGQTLVVDDRRGVAALGGDPMGRGEAASLSEVTLPDLDGNDVEFSGFIGRKTLLIAWASW